MRSNGTGRLRARFIACALNRVTKNSKMYMRSTGTGSLRTRYDLCAFDKIRVTKNAVMFPCVRLKKDHKERRKMSMRSLDQGH